MTDAVDLRQIVAALGPAGDEARLRREPLTDAVDRIAADLERLDQQHVAEFRALVERQAGERAALMVRLRGGRVRQGVAEAPRDPDPEPIETKRRRYWPAENEEWMYVDDAAAELRVSRATVWRWAWKHWAQWPHTAARVDFNKLRHLVRPPRAKNAKNEK